MKLWFNKEWNHWFWGQEPVYFPSVEDLEIAWGRKYPKLAKKLASRLRFFSDRIDYEGAPKAVGFSFTHENGKIAIHYEDKGCPLWYLSSKDADRSLDDSDAHGLRNCVVTFSVPTESQQLLNFYVRASSREQAVDRAVKLLPEHIKRMSRNWYNCVFDIVAYNDDFTNIYELPEYA